MRNKPDCFIVTKFIIINARVWRSPIFYRITLVLSLIAPGFLLADGSEHVSVEVIPLTAGVLPGSTFDVAMVFSMTDDWHTYWSNPGDAGMSTNFSWSLPGGFDVLEKREPVPSRHLDDDIVTFVHEKQAIYLFKIQAPQIVADTNRFQIKVDWLECKDICLAGSATLSFELAGIETELPSRPEWQSLLKMAQSHLPKAPAETMGRIRLKRNHLEFQLNGQQLLDGTLTGADFFPLEDLVYALGKPVRLKKRFGKSRILIPLDEDRPSEPDRLQGILIQTFSSPSGVETLSTIINSPIPN